MKDKLELRKKAMAEMFKQPSIEIKKKPSIEAHVESSEGEEAESSGPFLITEEEKQMILKMRKDEAKPEDGEEIAEE